MPVNAAAENVLGTMGTTAQLLIVDPCRQQELRLMHTFLRYSVLDDPAASAGVEELAREVHGGPLQLLRVSIRYVSSVCGAY